MARNTLTIGFAMGEASEGESERGRDYTQKTNEGLAGDNASPLPDADIACVGFKPPAKIREPELDEGVASRQAMADQLDAEDRLSFKRR
jgi:hypothetical protein